MSEEKKKIVLTGGHAGVTAIAVVERMRLMRPSRDWDIHWIGVSRSMEGMGSRSIEFKFLPKYGVKCHSIFTGRIQKKWTRYTLISLSKIPFGFIHSFVLLRKIAPDVILSFGGFAAFPVVFWGYFLRIPVLVHEQTVATGLSNKFSAFFAQKIAISREGSRKYFPKEKTILTGNPILSSIVEVKPKRNLPKYPLIYITGGSRGSQHINEAVSPILEALLKQFYIVHQTGEIDFDYFLERKNLLPIILKRRYRVKSFISPLRIAKIYERADIVVGRAGANTVSEIIITKRPSILIPIPWTRFDEQSKNAQLAKNIGIALIIEQDELTPEILQRKIGLLTKKWSRMVRTSLTPLGIKDAQASEKLVGLIKEILE